MRAVLPCLIWALAALLHGAPALAAQALRHDPFVRPPLMAPAPARPASASLVAPWQPTLSAVLVAGPDSLVNVGGFVIKLGQEIDGYRLLQVSEGQAVFLKNKKRIVLKMNAPDAGQSNQRGTQ